MTGSQDFGRHLCYFSRSLMKIRVLLAFLALIVSGSSQAGSILREVWQNIGGTAISSLTSDPRFPDSPDLSVQVTDFFEAPADWADNYGTRMRGYVVPPVTGDYAFWIATDDNGELWLSVDADPVNAVLISQVTGWTSSREWTKEANQQSAPIHLTANQPYYIEALQKEGSGGDNLAVRWLRPDGVDEGPIPATYLLPWGTVFTAPKITGQPSNTNAVEGGIATFTVTPDPLSPSTVKWQKGGVDIPGATSFTLNYGPVALGDNQAHFRAILSNSLGTTPSNDAILSVSPDTTPPQLISAINFGSTTVQVTFSEPVATASGLNRTNYQIAPGITVTGAAFGAASNVVRLTTTALAYGTNYTVTVNNVRDQAATPNTIATNSQRNFTALPYAPAVVGGASGGGVTGVAGGFVVTGAGANIGGTADQFQFAFEARTGDFDIRARVQSLDDTDPWAMAGLIAREDLTAGARFAGIFATPGTAGCFFEWRDPAGAAAGSLGSFPVNYPNTWLRLRRAGNQFTGFASYDGQNWTQLGSASMTLPSTLNFGLAVASRSASKLATAQFTDIGAVTNSSIVAQPNPSEPLGPCTRKTGLVISEIMYKPAARTDGRNLEFVEIFNSNPYAEDISGYRISGDVDFKFATNTILPGFGFLVVAAKPADIQAVYGITNVVGPYTNSLPKSGTVRLRNDVDSILLDIAYSNEAPWPPAADATGHSIVLARPSYGEWSPQAWAISDVVGGSAGIGEAYRPSPLRSVVINEFLAHTDPPLYDYIELYNHSIAAVDISGCYLSDDAKTNKFKIPAGTIVPGNGFVSFDETALGFRLSASGETIFFVNPDATRVLDAVRFEAQANSVSMGRYPDGAAEFFPLATRTPGAANGAAPISDVVINEIMYNPISGNDDDEYVELYNQGTTTINLSGWRFTAGIDYMFPTNTTVAPDSYLVVAKNVTNLIAHYTNLNSANTLGNFDGKLSGNGERVALGYPDTQITTNSTGAPKTNLVWIVVDEVTYGTGGRWGKWAGGGGSSLELINPRSNHRLAYNWGDSDETRKAQWTNIEATGVLDNGANYEASIAHFQVGQLGEGECLIDNVEIVPGASGNYASDGDFQSGLTGWTPQGDHIRSSLETTQGYNSSASLHIRASDQMWTGANSVQGTLNNTTLVSGQTVTLRFKARWLRGWPEALLRLNGNWLEAVGRMSIPLNLGTPGARNSRYVANAGPAIHQIAHSPTLPAAGQDALVTARVDDPDGIQSVVLKYRVDPATTYNSVTMNDLGTGGDAEARDGVFTGRIPGQALQTVVAFYIEATDSRGALTRFPQTLADNGPVREGMICFGDNTAPSAYGSYHLWLTQNSINRWAGLPDMSNEPNDGTFVSGERVIYNIGARYAGSPYHQQFDSPVGSQCHYHCEMPEDDQFLGTTSFNKIHAPGNGPFDDDTIQREQTAYWFVRKLGLPWNYRRYVAMYVNGNRRGSLMEDTQVPNGDVVKERFPDDTDGQLYKLQPWFEFDPNGSGFQNESWCNLNQYTTSGGAKKLARYRWNYLTRRASATANDYTNVFALVDAANHPANSAALIGNMNAQVDMEQWMRTFAVEHAVGNWDSFGAQNAQNMYAYKPSSGKWNLLIWDYNIVLGNSGSWGPGQNLFAYNGSDSGMPNLYNTFLYTRAYWRAMKELVNGPMQSASVNPIMDAKFATFKAEGLNVASPQATETWIATARSSIASQLANAGGNVAFQVNGIANWSTNQEQISINGTAPVEVKDIALNGVVYPVTWTDLKTWTLKVALAAGTNVMQITGVDRSGNAVTGASKDLSINFTGTADAATGRVVINEINYNSAAPKAGFIELLNTSQTTAFDLTGWILKGADFVFPGGSIIAPNGYLVIAQDAQGFANAYGASIPFAGVFTGKLSNTGETLKLVKPGATVDQDVVIDQVTYSGSAPWPSQANGFGPSLQLIDPTGDRSRVANWGIGSTNVVVPPPQWKQAVVTGTGSSSTLYVYLSGGGGDVYIDDIKLVAGSTPEVGANLVNNGDFESTLTGPWTKTANTTSSAISTAVVHSGSASLHLVCGAAGTTQGSSLWQTTQTLSANSTYTLSYWYLQSSNANTLTIRLSGSGIRSDQPILQDQGATTALYTPGAPNSVKASLPLPPIWLNEIEPTNATGIADHLGHRAPWAELYNAGATAVSLSGYYLSTNFTNLTAWAFPSGASIPARQFLKIFLDGQIAESTAAEFHTSFAVPPANGTLALSCTIAAKPLLLDYLQYGTVSADHSYGAYPDGAGAGRAYFATPTPGASNTLSAPIPLVFINEWMASNSKTIADPLDAKFHDWFELFNASADAVDLSGYILSDGSNNRSTIPQGLIMPAGAHLLAWADGTSSIGSGGELHASFSLKASGDSISLLAPNGAVVDTVTFTAQTTDVSQGRLPDGAPPPYQSLDKASPGAANTLASAPNSAPTLDPITDKTVAIGNTLMLQALGHDADAAQTLTYSLDANAIPGADINTASGVFTWTPLETQAPGIYSFTISVTDSGSPTLSATTAFNVQLINANHAPAIDPIVDKTVFVGNQLNLALHASDIDFPTQALTFSLDPGAPDGAAISAAGNFTWSPTAIQAGDTYRITARVTDNGTPSQSATASFNVSVVAANGLTWKSVGLDASGSVVLIWSSQPGITYDVQSRDKVDSAGWVTLGQVSATSNESSFIDNSVRTNATRFYLLRVPSQ